MTLDERCRRRVVAQGIDKDPLGSKLTAEAREKAIEFAAQAYGTQRVVSAIAVELGITHATSQIIKR